MKLRNPLIRPGSPAAFTMIEVALCLAIIAFALVAIIGILPTGMQVQKDNREDTIIAQEAKIWIEAIKTGSTNFLSLSNNLIFMERYTNGNGSAYVTNTVLSPDAIIGILTTPLNPYAMNTNCSVSNATMRAKFLAGSGPLAERAMTNRELSFTYLLTSEIVPFELPYATNYDAAFARNFTNNLFELRLTFRWPVYPNRTTGNNHQTYRVMLAGEFVYDSTNVNANDIFFFRAANFQTF